jgi:hypothetical protein
LENGETLLTLRTLAGLPLWAPYPKAHLCIRRPPPLLPPASEISKDLNSPAAGRKKKIRRRWRRVCGRLGSMRRKLRGRWPCCFCGS